MELNIHKCIQDEMKNFITLREKKDFSELQSYSRLRIFVRNHCTLFSADDLELLSKIYYYPTQLDKIFEIEFHCLKEFFFSILTNKSDTDSEEYKLKLYEFVLRFLSFKSQIESHNIFIEGFIEECRMLVIEKIENGLKSTLKTAASDVFYNTLHRKMLKI